MLVREPALEYLGELYAQNHVRRGDARAYRLPARLHIRGDGSRGRVLDLPLALLTLGVRLEHRLYLPDLFAGALLDALVGDLLVVEDHHLANRAAPRAHLLAYLDDGARNPRCAGDRFDDVDLAALDALRDLNLALARERAGRCPSRAGTSAPGRSSCRAPRASGRARCPRRRRAGRTSCPRGTCSETTTLISRRCQGF